MKTTFLLLLLPTWLFSQRLLNEDKKWNIMECVTGGWVSCYTQQFKFSGDTIVNNLTYKKLYSCDTTGANLHLRSLLREDTIAKKVFIYPPGSVQELLLYDFTLNAGDTVIAAGPYGYAFCTPMVVDVVNYVTSFGVSRREIVFNASLGYQADVWIEGIGNAQGLIHNFISICAADADAHLLCCDSAGIQIYQSIHYNTCFLSTLGVDENIVTDKISVSPNPFNDRLYFDFKNKSSHRIQLYDIVGKTIFLKQLNQGENSILLPDLNPGIYFCRVQSGREISTVKLIHVNYAVHN